MASTSEFELGSPPFVAAIVSPYDPQLPSAASALTWFRVEGIPSRLPDIDDNPLDTGCQPMALRVRMSCCARC